MDDAQSMLSIMSSSAWPGVGHLCNRCAGSSSSTVKSVCNVDQKKGHNSSYLFKNVVLLLQEIPRALKICAFNPTVLSSKRKQGEMSGWSIYVYSQCYIEIVRWVFPGCLCSSIYIQLCATLHSGDSYHHARCRKSHALGCTSGTTSVWRADQLVTQ